jgi:hypothetical protein
LSNPPFEQGVHLLCLTLKHPSANAQAQPKDTPQTWAQARLPGTLQASTRWTHSLTHSSVQWNHAPKPSTLPRDTPTPYPPAGGAASACQHWCYPACCPQRSRPRRRPSPGGAHSRPTRTPPRPTGINLSGHRTTRPTRPAGRPSRVLAPRGPLLPQGVGQTHLLHARASPPSHPRHRPCKGNHPLMSCFHTATPSYPHAPSASTPPASRATRLPHTLPVLSSSFNGFLPDGSPQHMHPAWRAARLSSPARLLLVGTSLSQASPRPQRLANHSSRGGAAALPGCLLPPSPAHRNCRTMQPAGRPPASSKQPLGECRAGPGSRATWLLWRARPPWPSPTPLRLAAAVAATAPAASVAPPTSPAPAHLPIPASRSHGS